MGVRKLLPVYSGSTSDPTEAEILVPLSRDDADGGVSSFDGNTPSHVYKCANKII